MDTKMKNKPVYIAFYSMNGGMGKSVMTTLTASFIHYLKEYRVAVVDYDYPQWSIHKQREKEIQLSENSIRYKNRLDTFYKNPGKSSYPIIPMERKEENSDTGNLLPDGLHEYDLVLFDMPSSCTHGDILQVLFEMDYVLIPISASWFDIDSCLRVILSMNKQINEGGMNLKQIYPYWTRVSRWDRRDAFEHIDDRIRKNGITPLKTAIPQHTCFQTCLPFTGSKDIFLSTLLPAENPYLKVCNIEAFAEEIIQIVNSQQ